MSEKNALVVQINSKVEAVFVRESNPLLIDKAAEILKERSVGQDAIEEMRRTMLVHGYERYIAPPHKGGECIEFTLAPAWED